MSLILAGELRSHKPLSVAQKKKKKSIEKINRYCQYVHGTLLSRSVMSDSLRPHGL